MKRLIISSFLLFSIIPAGAQVPFSDLFKHPARRAVEMENTKLKSKVDSLQALLDDMAAEKEAEQEAEAHIFDIPRVENQAVEVTDSLLSLWYQSNQLKDFDTVHEYNMDSLTFSSNVPDSVMIRRLADMNAYITLPFNETVRNYMVLYSEKMPTRMNRVLGLSAYYFPIFEETLAKYDLPLELKYMSIIESMLNPTATSRVGAKGIWQFMYRTAKTYGLNVDSFIDERMDVPKAVDAAARYMKDAYKVFGDWALAISSYNCGPGNVTKAIRRAGGSRYFWDIYPYLPRETRGYVPAFVGAMYAFTYYREYGLHPNDVGMPAQTDTLHIWKKLHFKQINEVVGVPMEDLQNLNPQYVHDIIPGTDKEACVLQLPYKWTGPFLDADQDSLYNHRLKELMSDDVLKAAENHKATSAEPARKVYRVKNGDYLGKIASRNHVTVAQIKKWNHLKSDKIRVGQVLYLYAR